MQNRFQFLTATVLLVGFARNAKADSIDHYVANLIKERQIPGLSIAVIRDGMVVKNPERLTADYTSRIDARFRKGISENISHMQFFNFLGSEKIVADHFMLDPTVTEIQHFQLTMANQDVYYQFRLNADGKIRLILSED